MNATLFVIGMVIVLLSSIVGWCLHTNPDMSSDNAKGFLFGLFGVPALLGLSVLFLVLLGIKWLHR